MWEAPSECHFIVPIVGPFTLDSETFLILLSGIVHLVHQTPNAKLRASYTSLGKLLSTYLLEPCLEMPTPGFPGSTGLLEDRTYVLGSLPPDRGPEIKMSK